MLGTGKYLGLPSMVGRDHTAVFSYIKYRVWQKINSIFQAIPSYVINIFLLPSPFISNK